MSNVRELLSASLVGGVYTTAADARQLASDACPEPSEDVILESAPCFETTVEDARAQAEDLGDSAPDELDCAAQDARALVVCFDNTNPCDGLISCNVSASCGVSLNAAFGACTPP